MRLFVGIDLPDPIKDRLLLLQGGIEGTRWQRRDQLHLTLRFIGEINGREADEIHFALDGIRFRTFDMALTGVGFFGKEYKPRHLWAGVRRPEPLMHLHEKIDRALTFAGIDAEQRKYRPHVTLARLKGRPEFAPFLAAHNDFRTQSFRVDHFCLFSSHLHRDGADYRIEEIYPASDAMLLEDVINILDIPAAE